MSILSKRAAINKLQAEMLVLQAIIAALGHTVTTAFTDGTDSTGIVQFVFKDADGNALTAPISGTVYFSDAATGLSTDALGTSAVVLTNGSLDEAITKTAYHFITDAVGKLGMTISNAAADSIWAVFIQPNGTLLISDEMAITQA